MLIYQPRKKDIYPILQMFIQTLGGRCGLGGKGEESTFPFASALVINYRGY